MPNRFNENIPVASGFSFGGSGPVDAKFTCATIKDRDDHVVFNRAYEGMICYVEENKVTYQYINGKWEEFGFSEAKFQNHLVNDLTTGGSTKALTAEMGKKLNDEKAPMSHTHLATEIETDKEHLFVSQLDKEFWNNKSDFDGNYENLTGVPTSQEELHNITSQITFPTK